MDDRDLEARLAARLHQRFDRVEPPLRLSRDISEARLMARPTSRRSGLISLLAAAAVLAVAAIALGAWFSRNGDVGAVPTASPAPTASPSPSPTPSPTPAPSPTPEPSPTPTPVAGAACVPASLTARVVRWEGAAGSRFGTIALQNTGAADCTVSGTPGVLLLDGSDHVFLNSVNLGGPATTTPTTPVFTLQPAKANTIYLVIGLSNYCGSAPTPPVSAGLDLPGQPGPAGRLLAKAAAGVTIDMAPCNGPGAPTTLKVQLPWSSTAP